MFVFMRKSIFEKTFILALFIFNGDIIWRFNEIDLTLIDKKISINNWNLRENP